MASQNIPSNIISSAFDTANDMLVDKIKLEVEKIEDIELTPKNFKNPIRPRNKNVYTTVGKKLFQEIHAFFEVVNIETDLDWFGLDEIENIKSDIFLKYDETFIMSNLIENNIYETGEAFCDVTFKLSENVHIQRRIYTKFVTILGDIGGFMEVIFTLFRIICSMSVDILYEISLVNRLFRFDIDFHDDPGDERVGTYTLKLHHALQRHGTEQWHAVIHNIKNKDMKEIEEHLRRAKEHLLEMWEDIN